MNKDNFPVSQLPISFEDIQAAARAIEGAVERTPMRLSRTLSSITGAEVWLKFENLQFTAAFKERGALNKLINLTDAEKKAGVIAMSAGNHAQGVAYHAQRLGIPATIVMPQNTPFVKVEHTRNFGARVILHGDMLTEADSFARETEKKEGLTFIHPYDDPLVVAGQGTVAIEMMEDGPEFDDLIVPVGGGGLIGGIAVAAKHMNPNIRIHGCEPLMYPSLHAAMRGEEAQVGGATIAEGIAVKTVGKIGAAICRELIEDVMLLDEAHLERAITLLLTVEKTVAEGAGAAGLAALLVLRQGPAPHGGSVHARRDEQRGGLRVRLRDHLGVEQDVIARRGKRDS